MPTPTSSAQEFVSAELVKQVNEVIKDWFRRTGLQWSDVYVSGTGLSASTVKRICKPKRTERLAEWLPRLDRLVSRFQEIAPEKTGNWSTFFGAGFPVPRFVPDPALFNNADVQREHIAALALPLIERLLSDAQSAKAKRNVWKASELFNHAAKLLEMTGQWERAARTLQDLGQLNEGTGDFHFHADALLREGQALLHSGYPVDAANRFHRGLQVIEQHKDKAPPHRLALRLHNYHAMALNELGDAEGALAILTEQSLFIAKRHCSRAALGSIYNRLAVVNVKLGRLSEARMSILEAVGIRLELDMRSETARSLVTLGSIHEQLGELSQALLIWEMALNWQYGMTDLESTPHSLFRIGSAYATLDRNESLAQKGLSVSLAQEHFPDSGEFRLLTIIGKTVGVEGLHVQRNRLRVEAVSAFRRCIDGERSLGQFRFSPDAKQAIEAIEALR